MFDKLKIRTDIYLMNYKYFVLNNYFNEYLNDNISYTDYYDLYNAHYIEQIKLYNAL